MLRHADDSTKTIDTSDIMDYLRYVLFEPWGIENQIFFRHYGSWREKFTINLALVLTRHEFCMTFNILEPDENFNLDT